MITLSKADLENYIERAISKCDQEKSSVRNSADYSKAQTFIDKVYREHRDAVDKEQHKGVQEIVVKSPSSTTIYIHKLYNRIIQEILLTFL